MAFYVGKSRKRPLASQLENVMEEGKEGRKSEVLLPLKEGEPLTASPLHQKRRSSVEPEDTTAADTDAEPAVCHGLQGLAIVNLHPLLA